MKRVHRCGKAKREQPVEIKGQFWSSSLSPSLDARRTNGRDLNAPGKTQVLPGPQRLLATGATWSCQLCCRSEYSRASAKQSDRLHHSRTLLVTRYLLLFGKKLITLYRTSKQIAVRSITKANGDDDLMAKFSGAYS